MDLSSNKGYMPESLADRGVEIISGVGFCYRRRKRRRLLRIRTEIGEKDSGLIWFPSRSDGAEIVEAMPPVFVGNDEDGDTIAAVLHSDTNDKNGGAGCNWEEMGSFWSDFGAAVSRHIRDEREETMRLNWCGYGAGFCWSLQDGDSGGGGAMDGGGVGVDWIEEDEGRLGLDVGPTY